MRDDVGTAVRVSVVEGAVVVVDEERVTEGSAFISGLAGGSVAGADGIASCSSHAVGASAVSLTAGAPPPSSPATLSTPGVGNLLGRRANLMNKRHFVSFSHIYIMYDV